MQKSISQPLKKQAINIDGKDRTDEIESYSFEGDKCVVIYKNNSKSYSYQRSKIQIIKSAIQTKESENIFNYLKEIAEKTGLKNNEEFNSLSDSFNKINFIPENSILSCYLNKKQLSKNLNSRPITIFPFGFNLSQKDSVNEAFSNPLSVIEGPPGTGKTQTILNIIANAVMNNQTVAIVSKNNSATKNVFEKLEKNDLSFIAALLGNSEKKKEFIASQTEIPDLSTWMLSAENEKNLQQSNSLLFEQLSEKLEFKNELASLKLVIKNVEKEYEHFTSSNFLSAELLFKKNIKSTQLLSLWITIENYEQTGKKFNWWRTLFFLFSFGIRDKNFYKLSYQELILLVQSKYYIAKISELKHRKEQIELELQNFYFDRKMKLHTDVSMQLFKNHLYKKYKGKERPHYSERDLIGQSKDFIRDYPVIMSTTYSLKRCLEGNMMYDYVIIDESSQVDLVTGALTLSCAKNAVIVGDLKQLPNVVDSKQRKITDSIFHSYQLPEVYRYSNHSILSSITELFPDIPKTLLREHYRCHPQIIDFCNRKFYDNQLIILSEARIDRNPLLVYKTVAGNHARDKTNQRQIDVIIQEIIPEEGLDNVDLGIVTPYSNQTNALQNTFKGTNIKADTVDKFQGRENDIIILSTVDNEISDFTANANRLNVAISRAKDQLILVVNGNENVKDNNISDLIRYIDYQNFNIVNSELHSIFDYLYKGYEEQLRTILSKHNKKSVYDSENLMYALVKEVLSEEEFSKYDVVLHFPLRNLILNFDRLSPEEGRYARHHATHLDFIIYNKLGKNPVLAIEVDGYEYHQKESRQYERDQMKNGILEKYGIPLVRFSTTGSRERERLIEILRTISS